VRTRLSDLAVQAGVSTATVSRVLNGKAGVSGETRQAVLAALDLLGYERPEKLKSHSAGLIGLVVPELTNPVFPAFAQVIESRLSEHGYTPLLCTQSPGGTTEDEYIEMLLDHGVAGIIFVSGLHADVTASHDRYHRLRDRGVHLVMINGWAEGIDAPFISNDDYNSMELSVRHLVSLGHRKIGLAIGQDRYVTVRRKVEGFTTSIARHLGEQDVVTADGLGRDVSRVALGQRRRDKSDSAGDTVLRTAVRTRCQARALGRGVDERGPYVEHESELEHRDEQDHDESADQHEPDSRRAFVGCVAGPPACGQGPLTPLTASVKSSLSRPPAAAHKMMTRPALIIVTSTHPGTSPLS